MVGAARYCNPWDLGGFLVFRCFSYAGVIVFQPVESHAGRRPAGEKCEKSGQSNWLLATLIRQRKVHDRTNYGSCQHDADGQEGRSQSKELRGSFGCPAFTSC